MRGFIILVAAGLALSTTVASAEAPSARNVYVERRGLMEADAQCRLLTPEVHAALQVTAMQARGVLLRGGWSITQMDQLEQATVAAARERACNDPRTLSAANVARAVCGDAAVYFKPRDAVDAAEQVQRLLTSGSLWNGLVTKGKHVLEGLPMPRQRYLEYVALLRRLKDGSPLLLEPPSLRRAA